MNSLLFIRHNTGENIGPKRVPIPAAARFKVWVAGHSLAVIAGSNPVGGMDVYRFCECCALSGSGLCDEVIIRSEESYRMCCI